MGPHSRPGGGGGACDSVKGLTVPRRVYYQHPATGDLVVCVTKSVKLDRAATHPGGLAAWQADAMKEVKALKILAGVAGVVGFRDVITGPDGALHIILQ